MEGDARDLLNAIGAMAELCGELYRQLVKNGFTHEDALRLVKAYLVATLTGEAE